MSEIQITDADSEVVATYLRECASKQMMAVVMITRCDDLAKHFAAHRHSAERTEREMCVGIIREAERKRFAKCLLENPDTVGVYFTAEELIYQITKAGGTRG